MATQESHRKIDKCTHQETTSEPVGTKGGYTSPLQNYSKEQERRLTSETSDMEVPDNGPQATDEQEDVEKKWQSILDKLDRMMEKQKKNIEDNILLMITPEHKV